MIFDGDVRMIMTEDGADIAFTGGQPEMDGGLSTAVLISLWSLSGWWGNQIMDQDQAFGCELETAMSGTLTVQAMLDAEEAARKALAWLVEQGIAARVTVEGSIPRADVLVLTITIAEPAGGAASLRYSLNWRNQSARLEALT